MRDASVCLPTLSVTGSQIRPATILNSITASRSADGWIITPFSSSRRRTISGNWATAAFHFVQPRVQRRRGFEVEIGGRLVALLLDLAYQRLAAALKELLHAIDLGGILLVGAAFEARRQAHLHLGINAAGKGGVGMKVVDAASHLEQIERVVGELLRRNAREKRAVILRVALRSLPMRVVTIARG